MKRHWLSVAIVFGPILAILLSSLVVREWRVWMFVAIQLGSVAFGGLLNWLFAPAEAVSSARDTSWPKATNARQHRGPEAQAVGRFQKPLDQARFTGESKARSWYGLVCVSFSSLLLVIAAVMDAGPFSLLFGLLAGWGWLCIILNLKYYVQVGDGRIWWSGLLGQSRFLEIDEIEAFERTINDSCDVVCRFHNGRRKMLRFVCFPMDQEQFITAVIAERPEIVVE